MAKNLIFKKNPASLTKRVLAFFIDVLIIDLIIVMPFNKYIESITNGQNGFNYFYSFVLKNPDIIFQLAIISFIIFVLSVAYWSILEFKTRQSIGKMLMNIKVMSKKKGFLFTQCIVRNISKPITILFLFDVLYMVFKKEKQRYFEKISDTVVVEEVLQI